MFGVGAALHSDLPFPKGLGHQKSLRGAAFAQNSDLSQGMDPVRLVRDRRVGSQFATDEGEPVGGKPRATESRIGLGMVQTTPIGGRACIFASIDGVVRPLVGLP